MRTTVSIQNLKCDGCKNVISKKLQILAGISDCTIDVASSTISFNYSTHNAMEGLRMELATMGYPITGDPNTIVDKAKSYVNCAVGRLTTKDIF